MNFLRSSPAPTSAQPQSDVPWLISTLAKAVGTMSGVFGIVIGFLSLFSIFDTSCILAGGLLILEGLVMCLLEAPCFCPFLDFAYTPSTYMEGRPHWLKATLYLFFAGIPFFFCIGLSTFLSCGLILVSCALYLMMSLGRKASFDEMRFQANNLSEKPSAVLVNNEHLAKGTDPPPTYRQSEAMASYPNVSATQTQVY